MPLVYSDEEKIRWYLIAAFIADLAGLLDDKKEQKLTYLTAQFGADEPWRAVVLRDLGLDESFVGRVYSVCRTGMPRSWAMCFVLRGLGCPDPEARLREVVGEALDKE